MRTIQDVLDQYEPRPDSCAETIDRDSGRIFESKAAKAKWAALLPPNAYGPVIVRKLPPVSSPRYRPYRGTIRVTQPVKTFVMPHTVSIGCSYTVGLPSMRWGLNIGHFRAWMIGSSTDVINAVCGAFGIPRNDLLSTRRTNVVAYPRFAAALLFKEYTEWSLPRIGRILKRDHTSIMNAITRAKVLERDDPDFAEKINEARRSLKKTVTT